MNLLIISLIISSVIGLGLLFRWGYRDLLTRVASIRTPETPQVPSVQELIDQMESDKKKRESDLVSVNQNSPYHFLIKNTSNKKQKVVLFGYSRYGHEVNYGSDIGVEVDGNYADCPYAEALKESAFKPFTVGLIRLIAKDRKQFQNDLHYVYKEGTGRMSQSPLMIPREDYATDNRNQKNVLDRTFNATFDTSAFIWFEIEPDSELTLILFKTSEVSLRKALRSTSLEEANYMFPQSEESKEFRSELEKKHDARRAEYDKMALDKLKKEKPELFNEKGEHKVIVKAVKKEGEESDSVEVNADNIEEIKEGAPDEKEATPLESVENYVHTPNEEGESDEPAVIQLTVSNNEDDTATLIGLKLMNLIIHPLEVTPSRSLAKLEDIDLQNVWIDMVRIQSSETIMSCIGKMGNSTEMAKGGRFIPDNELEGGIVDIRYKNEELQLSDLHLEVKGHSQITLTLFPVEYVEETEGNKSEEE